MGLDDDDILDWLLMAINPKTYWDFFTKDVPSVPAQDVKAWAKSEVGGTFKTAVEIQTLGSLSRVTGAWSGVSGFLGRNAVLGTTLAAEETTYRWVVEGQAPTLEGFAKEAGGYAAGGMLLEGGFVVGGRVFAFVGEGAGKAYNFFRSPKANPLNWRLAPPEGLQGSMGVPNFNLRYVGPEAGMRVVSAGSKQTFASVMTKEELAAWKELEAKYPHFMPDINTGIRVLTPAEVKAARAMVESGSRGHHRHGLAFGGPPNPPGGLVHTGETQTVKDPAHSEVSTFFFRLLMRLRREAGQ
jgi:hypothetical protein